MGPLRKILVATDFGPTSLEAEEHARRVALPVSAQCLLLHVIERIEGDDDDTQKFYQTLEARARTELEKAEKRFCDAGVECWGRVAIGARAQTILETAEAEEFDLIVMGSHEVVIDGRPYFGTTSHKVFSAARTPLLIVR